MTRVHYEIPDDLHRRAKAAAALDGVTFKDFIIKAIEAATARNEKKTRIRPARVGPKSKKEQ
jgi:hypothetical protein